MASIQDRWRRRDPATGRLVPTELDGKGLRYRPQFRDPSGRQIMKGVRAQAGRTALAG
jgi:hypothetical protein